MAKTNGNGNGNGNYYINGGNGGTSSGGSSKVTTGQYKGKTKAKTKAKTGQYTGKKGGGKQQPNKSTFVPTNSSVTRRRRMVGRTSWTSGLKNVYTASNLRWLDREIPSGFTLQEQLQFASYQIVQKLAWHRGTGPTDLRHNLGQYQFDFREYPSRIKKFFLPGTGAGSEGLRPIPTQRLNIQTNTFKTNPLVYFNAMENGFGEVDFQEIL